MAENECVTFVYILVTYDSSVVHKKVVQKHSLTGFDVARCATKQSSTQHQACELVYGKHRPTFPNFQQDN